MWQWLIADSHWIWVWAGVGLAFDSVAQVLPAGTAQRVLQALAHCSPAALVSAYRALRGSP